MGPPSDANVGLYTPLKLVRYLRIINHSESGVINKLSYPGGQKHCMIPSRNIAIVSTSDFHIVGLKVPKMRSWRFFLWGCCHWLYHTYPRCEPWCWNIYLQNWVMFGVNVGKYSIHGAFGYLCILGILQSNGSSDLQSLAFCLSRSFRAGFLFLQILWC